MDKNTGLFDSAFVSAVFSSALGLLILIGILSFVTPILVYLLCSKVIKKPLLNIPISLLLFLYSVYEEVFSFRIQLGMDINIIENFLDVFNGDSIMLFYFMWLPGIISFFAINIAAFIQRLMNKEAEK